jgi:hypothetical protein
MAEAVAESGKEIEESLRRGDHVIKGQREVSSDESTTREQEEELET